MLVDGSHRMWNSSPLSKIHYLIIKFEIVLLPVLLKRDEIGQFKLKEHSVLVLDLGITF